MKTPHSDVVHSGSRWPRCGGRIFAVLLLLLGAAVAFADNAVTTLAGTALQPGFVDDTGAAARFRFYTTAGAVVDSGGNVFVTDTQNNAIRKITPAGVVTTFAGSTAGTAGADNGTGTAARFNNPEGIAIDSGDNLYVADTGNQLIRKITSAGLVTTIAGSGTAGFTDATGTSAQFRSPTGVAVAPASGTATTLFVCDNQNNAVRQIVLSSQAVTTLAGSTAGTSGSTDATNTDARFSSPVAIVSDATGATLYVADAGNNVVRKIAISGATATVTTLAGSGASGYANGTGTAAQFNSPHGIALDASGNILVADTLTQTIRSITSAGVVSLFAGTPSTAGTADGMAIGAAMFNTPTGLAVSGTTAVYVVDSANFTVRKISAATAPVITLDPASTTVAVGTNVTFTGTATGNPAVTYQWQRMRTGDASFSNLTNGGAYSGATTSTLTITGVTALMNGDQYRLVATNAVGSATSASAQLTPTLGLLFSTLAGQTGVSGAVDARGSAARFHAPQGVVADTYGDVFVADTANNEIREITPTGFVSTFAGSTSGFGGADGIGTAAQFSSPVGLAIDSTGNLYVADSANQTIRKVQPNGNVTTIAGTAMSDGSADGVGGAARFSFPNGVAVDATGVVYVADTVNDTIRKIATNGTVTTIAGTPGTRGSADGNGSAAQFNLPAGIAVDGSGNLYVADTQNSTIRKVTPTGDVTTLAGQAGSPGTADGTGSAARFNQPKAIVLVDANTLYVADTMNDTIRKVTTAGVVTTIAGGAGIAGSTDAIGTDARFNQPSGIALDNLGNVYVADTQNQTIRRTGAFTAPVITTQPSDQATRAAISASFTATATAVPAPSYQWQRQPAGTSGFFNVDNGATFSGATTNTLTITSPTEAMSGDQFRVVVTNLVNPSATSHAATLTVGPPTLPPTISTQPANVSVAVGAPASLSVVASGSGTLTYQWWKDATQIAGATGATLSISSAQPANAGTYTVVISNAFGTATSTPATLSLNGAPVATTPSRAQVGLAGGSVTLTANLTGSSGITYQWRKNGTAISGATNATLTLTNLAAADAGLYDVVASNGNGSTTTAPTQLAVAAAPTAPVITAQPASLTAASGAPATLSVSAAGAPAPTYQWRKNGTAISGATGSSLITNSLQASDAGNYDVVVTNSAGSVTSNTAAVRVLAHSYAGVYFGSFGNGLGTFAVYVRPDNTGVFLGMVPTSSAPIATTKLSISDTGDFTFTQAATTQLGAVTVAGNISTNGTVTGTLSGAASATLSASRSSDQGPTQNVAGLYLAGALDSAGNTLTIVSATGQAYALTQTAAASDGGAGVVNASGQVVVNTGRTAINESITAATGAATVTDVGAINASYTGASDTGLRTQRLANISTRAYVSGGAPVEIAGFVIGGTSSKLLLIRAVGPSLSTVGVSGVLAAPRLDLYRGQSLIASNVGVANSPDAAAIAAAGAAVGAFAPNLNPADSALLITLPPGNYTAQVSGADGGAGIALAEVYDLSATEAGQKLLNISTRATAASGDSTLIAGVVVTGSVPKRVLVRAVGPGLATYSVSDFVAQPVLTLKTQGGQTIAQNTGWTTSADATAITSAGNDTGAFPLVTGDSALIVTLAPGNYSAQVTGLNGSSGIALVEIYELQ